MNGPGAAISLHDVHLARERLKRHVVVTLPYFNLAPYVLIKSDLIFTTTRLFAEGGDGGDTPGAQAVDEFAYPQLARRLADLIEDVCD